MRMKDIGLKKTLFIQKIIQMRNTLCTALKVSPVQEKGEQKSRLSGVYNCRVSCNSHAQIAYQEAYHVSFQDD